MSCGVVRRRIEQQDEAFLRLRKRFHFLVKGSDIEFARLVKERKGLDFPTDFLGDGVVRRPMPIRGEDGVAQL